MKQQPNCKKTINPRLEIEEKPSHETNDDNNDAASTNSGLVVNPDTATKAGEELTAIYPPMIIQQYENSLSDLFCTICWIC